MDLKFLNFIFKGVISLECRSSHIFESLSSGVTYICDETEFSDGRKRIDVRRPNSSFYLCHICFRPDNKHSLYEHLSKLIIKYDL